MSCGVCGVAYNRERRAKWSKMMSKSSDELRVRGAVGRLGVLQACRRDLATTSHDGVPMNVNDTKGASLPDRRMQSVVVFFGCFPLLVLVLGGFFGGLHPHDPVRRTANVKPEPSIPSSSFLKQAGCTAPVVSVQLARQ